VIRYRGVELANRTFDKIRQVDQGAIADNKRLGPILAMIRDEQLRRGPERPSGPRRAINATPVCSESAGPLYATSQANRRSLGRTTGSVASYSKLCEMTKPIRQIGVLTF
jgi:hypothetical protein